MCKKNHIFRSLSISFFRTKMFFLPLIVLLFPILILASQPAGPVKAYGFIITNSAANYKFPDASVSFTTLDYKDHFKNQKVVLDLQRNGFKVFWVAEKVGCFGNKWGSNAYKPITLLPGDYIVPVEGYSQEQLQYLYSMLENNIGQVNVMILTSPLKAIVYPLNYPRILMSHQSWAGCYWWYYDCLLDGGFDWDTAYADQDKVSRIDPKRYALFVEPGGSGNIPPVFRKALIDYVKRKGSYIGSCWGAMMAVSPKSYPKKEEAWHKKWWTEQCGSGISDCMDTTTRRWDWSKIPGFPSPLVGVGHIILHNEDPTHPVMWGVPTYFDNIYWNGPLMGNLGPNAKALARFVQVVEDEYNFARDHTIGTPDGDLTWKDIQDDVNLAAYVFSQRRGQGKVLAFGPHPEASEGRNPFDKYDVGYKIVFNSVFYTTCGDKKKYTPARTISIDEVSKRSPMSRKRDVSHEALPVEAIKSKVQAAKDRALELIAATGVDEDDHAGWLLLRTIDALHAIRDNTDNLARHYLDLQELGTPKSAGYLTQIKEWPKKVEPILDKLIVELKAVDVSKIQKGWWNPGKAWIPKFGPTWDQGRRVSMLSKDVSYFLNYAMK